MQNNLQANFNTIIFDLFFIESEEIKISKKLAKKIEKDSWLELNSAVLQVKVVDNKRYKRAKICSKDDYIFLKVENSDKKYQQLDSRDFYIKIPFKSICGLSNIALSKNPLNGILMKKNSEFAKIKLYFMDKVYINIEGIL